MVVQLAQDQKKKIYDFLDEFGMGQYFEAVEKILTSQASGEFALNLLKTFYQEGIRVGGERVEGLIKSKLNSTVEVSAGNPGAEKQNPNNSQAGLLPKELRQRIYEAVESVFLKWEGENNGKRIGVTDTKTT